MQRDRGGDQRGGRSQRDFGDTQQYDRGGEYGDTGDRSGGRMNREQQSGGGLEYEQRGRRSEQGDWTESRESDRGSSGDRNQQLQDDMSNRRHVHERDPTADEDRARDEDWSS
ncbi:hypothetical protein FEJ81_02715 [Natrinema versiforme]|uniref:Uncharacterized protein n=2 Tax=Natrinema versiforme TaxID=88724 RepID=A0A4P8WLM1_9EURY|nr:hypothetical protein FEJ81_02715 [Natrinema versiforme]